MKKRSRAQKGAEPIAEYTALPYVVAARRIAAGEFKARCLQLMDDVRDRHEEIVITKYGRPVAKLVPVEEVMPTARGFLQGMITIHGDIVSPNSDAWEMSDDEIE